jgi:hypothetical protein
MNKVKAENIAARFNAMAKHPGITYAASAASAVTVDGEASYRIIQMLDGFPVGVALGARGQKKKKRLGLFQERG